MFAETQKNHNQWAKHASFLKKVNVYYTKNCIMYYYCVYSVLLLWILTMKALKMHCPKHIWKNVSLAEINNKYHNNNCTTYSVFAN